MGVFFKAKNVNNYTVGKGGVGRITNIWSEMHSNKEQATIPPFKERNRKHTKFTRSSP